MAPLVRSFGWPGRVVHGFLGGASISIARQTIAEGIEPVRALSGYSLLTGLGLVLGLVRELTVASTFGLSLQLDIFVAVMTVQLFFGAQVGNALETAFIGRVAGQGGLDVVLRSLRPAIYGLLLVNTGVILCLFTSGPFVLEMVFPRFEGGQQTLAMHTLRALLMPIAFASTAGLLRGALAVLGSFAPGFLAGSIVSVCTIVSIMLFSSPLGIDALTLGVAVGNLGVLGLFAGRLALFKQGSLSERPSSALAVRQDGWFVLWGTAALVLVRELVYAGVALTERSLASQLPAGSIAAFFYASTIVSVPLSLIVLPLTTVMFPGMVETFKRDIQAGFSQLRIQVFLLVAASVAVVLVVIPLSQLIIESVFMRGQFTVEHSRFTASILSVTILALPFMSVGRLLRNTCYSLSDYRTPLTGLIAQLAMLAGLGLLVVPRYGAQGLAIAMVAGEATTLLAMALVLSKRLYAQ